MKLSISTGLAALLIATAPLAANAADRDLRVAYDVGDISSLDPHRASSHVDRAIASMVFNGLVRLPAGTANMGAIEPDLAESWEQSEDGLTWTFHLRPGVMFQGWDGGEPYEMTAEDVVFSLNKSMDPEQSAYSGEYAGITIAAPDPMTVTITTPEPLSQTLMLAKLMNYGAGFIISKRAYEDMGADGFRLHPVGTGPFGFSSYTPQSEVDLVANENYFRGAPKLPGVDILFMADVSARGIGLRTGELDVIEGSSEQSWVQLMERYPNIDVEVFGPGSASVLFLNMDNPPLDDIRVRQAIAHAISRDAVVAAIGPATATPLLAPFPGEYLPGGLTNDEVVADGLNYDYDPEKARELLAEAGYPDGITLKVIHTELSVMLRPMENIQAQLRDAGINLDLQVVDHATYHSLIRDDASQVVHYMAWRPNADVFLTRFYDSASDISDGSSPDTNFSHYSGVDDLIAEARNTVDTQEQAALWKQASEQILRDLPAIPVFQGRSAIAHTDALELGYELEGNLAFFLPVTEQTDIAE
ncbi:polyamine ABC transporter substrate-binding protein [Martelella mediterranea]|uniref:ABC transporter substrate-binding protein n=1 Tax=Martelella mediterranea TaxID=293089 RepID=UPI001E43A7C2|nr:ABC transporter substrate-binding protein [Martelella mediterranea]MCD1636473.1 polyamine ABC transporter substrate-binding protein [Martelella mediterranea]